MQEDDCEGENSSSQLAALEVGELLMVRRTLLQASKEKETTQRRKLFRTTCKCNGKVCKVVVDSGSIDIVVSTKMVDKLKLEKLPHETPYKVSWPNDDQSILVSEQAFIEFNIGGYKDKLLCDVLPMDCCHLLLGRPWHFDRHAIYDGINNTY